MKNYFIILSLILLIIACKKNSSLEHEKSVQIFQDELNAQFADPERSPMTEEDQKTFKTLDFFDIDSSYKIEAEFELTPDTQVFEMQTTTDRQPLYRKYGIARFVLFGKKLELSIFQNQKLMTSSEDSDHLFLPFNDLTNGDDSYGGGRFIDLKIPESGSKTIVFDFNLAYNPYCAYNPKYSCPIPPDENNLDIAIPVGVKTFGNHH